jgi:hypothetical protein
MSASAALARVCLHEHAHLVAARALGAYGFVRIVRVAGGDDGWAGAFQMHGTLDDRGWRIVALAGTLAEWLDEAPGLGVDEAHARLRADRALSRDDALLAAGYDAADVAGCLAVLRAHWREIVDEAEDRAAETSRGRACARPLMTTSY